MARQKLKNSQESARGTHGTGKDSGSQGTWLAGSYRRLLVDSCCGRAGGRLADRQPVLSYKPESLQAGLGGHLHLRIVLS